MSTSSGSLSPSGASPEPVLVIHGVANRNRDEFESTVEHFEASVNRAGGAGRTFRFVPVFWGDLVPDGAALKCAIPPPAPCDLTKPLSLPGVDIKPAAGVNVLGLIGKVLDKAMTIGPLERLAERQTSSLRRAVLPSASEGLGDLFVYVDCYEPIHKCLRNVLAQVGDGWGTPDKPISVLGHSLGGIIAFDAARSTSPISIKHFVTFGSQSAVLHILDPGREIVRPLTETVLTLQGLPPFNGHDKVRLPSSIRSWLSVWHAMDPLAFLAGTVFQLHDGSRVADKQIKGQEGTWSNAHSCYWKHTQMSDLASAALRGGEVGSTP